METPPRSIITCKAADRSSLTKCQSWNDSHPWLEGWGLTRRERSRRKLANRTARDRWYWRWFVSGASLALRCHPLSREDGRGGKRMGKEREWQGGWTNNSRSNSRSLKGQESSRERFCCGLSGSCDRITPKRGTPTPWALYSRHNRIIYTGNICVYGPERPHGLCIRPCETSDQVYPLLCTHIHTYMHV